LKTGGVVERGVGAERATDRPMQRKKLMILGAGPCQVPILMLAREMGFETVVVSPSGDYPGLRVADRVFEADVRDKERILASARQERIDGIVTDQTDLPVATVAWVAERLGLPGIGYACALAFTDKTKMRALCRRIGIPVPDFRGASSVSGTVAAAREIGFPVMIKPADNQGSRGVTRVGDEGGIEAAFRSAVPFSATGRVIVEAFVRGREVVVQGFASGGDFVNLVIGDREYFDLPGLFIPSRTLFPSRLREDLRREVLALNARLVNGFAPAFALTHSEYLVDEETGEIRLVEVAARGGGVFISSDLVPLACGIDTNRLLLELAAGRRERVNLRDAPRRERASGYACFYLPEGVISDVAGVARAASLPGVHRAFLEGLTPGTRTQPLSHKAMRLGPVLVAGADRTALDEVLREVQRVLRITVTTPDGRGGIHW